MMEPDKETRMNAYAMLADVVRSYEPDTLDENTVDSLKFMLKHPTFAPIHNVIADKIIEIGNYFKRQTERVIHTDDGGKPVNKPKRTPDNRKKRKRAANAGDIPEGSTPGPSMTFMQDPQTGLLVPIIRSDS